ncbi:MAG: squalene synthase HpnC [Frankiaceae bacterium]
MRDARVPAGAARSGVHRAGGSLLGTGWPANPASPTNPASPSRPGATRAAYSSPARERAVPPSCDPATMLAALVRPEAEQAENFPVAMRVLPRRYRDQLRACYSFARLVDDAGDCDATPADRLAMLDLLDADLTGVAAAGPGRVPAVAGLQIMLDPGTVAVDPFRALIAANRRDQTVTRYESFDDLVDYCELSANPVGHIVLGIFGADGDRARQYSDRVCTALQIIEHCQDVGEDLRRGRVYLPQQDLRAYGVGEDDLCGRAAGPRLRRLVAFESLRAARMLESGAPIVRHLQGWARLAVAGYLAGGRAAIEGLRRVEFDVLGSLARARRRDAARHALALCLGR